MSANKFFLDTNIFVNSFNQSVPHKQKKSKRLIEESLSGEGCTSYHVIEEFMSLYSHGFSPPITTAQAQRYLQQVLTPLCDYYPSEDFYQRCLDIQERWLFNWHDSLIIASALETGSEVLFSEDLQHNQKIETLMIINPFVNY